MKSFARLFSSWIYVRLSFEVGRCRCVARSFRGSNRFLSLVIFGNVPVFLIGELRSNSIGFATRYPDEGVSPNRVANCRLDCSHDQRNNKLHEQSEVHLVIPATIEASEARLIQPDGTAQAKRSVAWVCFIVTLWMDWTSEPLGMVRGGWGCVGVGVVL